MRATPNGPQTNQDALTEHLSHAESSPDGMLMSNAYV